MLTTQSDRNLETLWLKSHDRTCKTGKLATRQPEKRPTFAGIALHEHKRSFLLQAYNMVKNTATWVAATHPGVTALEVLLSSPLLPSRSQSVCKF